MSWDVYLLKTPTNREKDLSEVTEAAPMPCWRELRQMLRCRFPDLISGYAQLESGIQFPVLSSPDYLLEFNLAVDSEEEPLTGIMFHRPGCGERWAYPLKFLCDLLDARIIDCGGGDFWDWDHLPGWIAKGL